MPPELPPTFSDATPLVNALTLRRDPFAFFTRLAAEAGPVAHYQLPSGTVYFFNDPALIREVLTSQAANFLKWEYNGGLHEIVGDGLLTSEGRLHQRMQRVVAPVFHQGRVPEYARQMIDLTRQRLATWEDDAVIDVGREVGRLTLDIVAQVLFGVPLEGWRETVRDATHAALLRSDRLGTSAGDDREFYASIARLDEVAAFILAERRRQGLADGDLVDLLLHAQETDAELVTDTQIRAEIRTFLLAGHVTVANVLAGALWHLAHDPALGAALGAHVDAILDGRPGRPPTLADLPELGLCENVLWETMRLYPPTWVLGREALGEVRLGGYTLPRGAKLVIVPWLLHRDPARFPEPEAFQVSRWEGNARADLPRGAYLPFSIGPRSCLGERFAMLEGMLLLSMIAGRWEFRELPDGPDPGWSPQVILWPRRGIRLRATRRQPVGAVPQISPP